MTAAYSIKIDFDKSLDRNPERVFESMASFVKGFNELQSAFIYGFGSEIEFHSTLCRTREGSCIADIAHNIQEKVRFLNLTDIWVSIYRGLEGAVAKPRVIDTEADVSNFITEVTDAVKNQEKYFTSHSNPDPLIVANALKTIAEGVSKLTENDFSGIAIDDKFSEINKGFYFPRNPNDIFSKNIKSYPTREILIIKRADYVGNSKWEFLSLKRKGKAILAKITHEDWLNSWYNHEIQLWPGDGLTVDIVTRVTNSKNKTNAHYEDEIVKVIGVVPQSEIKQLELDL